MLRSVVVGILLSCLLQVAWSQEKVVVVPKKIDGAPFFVDDSTDLFAKSYRFFIEGDVSYAADSLRKLISMSSYELDPESYYLVVANFTDQVSPIGMFHGDSDFLDTRMYGLKDEKVYYMFISRTPDAPSFVSVLLKAKKTPFEENFPAFLNLFGIGLPIALESPDRRTWIDVREINIPEKFKRVSDISVIVKKDLSDDDFLASAVFDNTPLERWSYGVATAITTINDIILEVGDDGRIIVKPRPNGDLAVFGVVNFHFKPVDTKAPSLASSIHLLGGLRLANFIEPMVGVGLGVPIAGIELHGFGGASLAFRNELKEGFEVGQLLTEEDVDPFKLDIKFFPRFGLEVKFP